MTEQTSKANNTKDKWCKFIIGEYTVESYRHGWKYYPHESPADVRYYRTLDVLLLNLTDLKLRRASIRSLQDIIEQVTLIKQEIANSLPDELRKKP